MEGQEKYICRAAYRDEWQEAMGLAWRVFLRFDAADYPEEGVKSFYNFVTDSALQRMFIVGSYQMFCAFENGKMVGMITLRESEHISLLFVDGAHHKKGIGTKLVDEVRNYILTEVGGSRITVHSSPYAVNFYHKLGFRDLAPEQEADGIRFTPMEFYL
ncbi:MAG: GNAT family N-acetyltransferase [Lachnospiraceae bacterium]